MKFGSSKQEESEPGRSQMYTIEDKVRDMDLDNYAIDMDNNHNYGNRKKENAKKKTLSSFFCCSGSTTQQDEINMAKEVNIKDHLLSVIDLERKFATNLTLGLTQSEAQFRLKRDGPNAFSPPKMTPAWVELLKELTAGFSLLFWISGAASLVCYAFSRLPQDYYLAIVLFSVVILTGLYSWSQKQSNKKIFDSFKKMMPQETIVIRDGKAVKMSAENLVCGDLVQCKAGERIPADVRILNCEGMKVDNSTLTGESEPLSRSPEFVHPQPLEAKNLAFFSTSCVEGSGLGMVIATGDDTVMGKIAKLVTNLQTRDAPIVREVNRFVVIIAVIAICEGLTFFVICMLLKMNLFASLIFTIGIITGNIPEGLLPSVTVSLTITAKKLAAKNCMIKYLEAVEILGSTSTICSDKTGTLTENRMTVEHCYLAGSIIRVPHDRIKVGELTRGVAQCWNAYQRCAKLCSRAYFNQDSLEQDIMKREVNGDASETAILRFMESISDQSVDNYRESLPKVAEKPFSSVYKYQYSVHRNLDPNQSNGSDFFVVMKGAPERILSLCSKIIDKNGNTVPLTEQDLKDFEHAYRELGSLGERVLAFCDTELHGFAVDHHFNLEDESTADFEIKNMRFIGLVAMIDPPRASVPGAVRKCKDAGINVVMVTGDHPITAQAIAKSVGIITASHRRSTQISLLKIDKQINQKRNTASIVVPGDELAVLTDAELRDILRSFNEIVFARTSPQQKLRIVENFQSLDKIVAVTGDGVNDSPALKKADIGVAMGITGSDVSKQAADMILMDDNFATIVLGVEEGRKIFDNLKKTTSYITAGSISTLYPFIFYLVFGFPVSITSLLILCICLGTDMMPAISLSYEKAESDIMRQQPRNPVKDYLVTRSLLLWSLFQGGMIVTLSGFTGYFVTLMQYGWMPWQLWQLRNGWDLDVTMVDWYNQEMNLTQRNLIMNKAQTAYFVSVVVCQVMNVIMNKTRRRSIFTHQMGNWVLNFAILFEVALCCAMVYTPGLNKALTCTPVSGWPWATGVPFALYILCYEELRKWIVRSWPTSWIGAELTR